MRNYQIFEYHFTTEFPEALIRRSLTLTVHYGALLVLLAKICFLHSTYQIFIVLFQIHSSSVISSFRDSFEKIRKRIFYIAGGLGRRKICRTASKH